ncbi:MAG: chromate efflux transporter [Gemmatimonadaceae bacterium]|nr:chromate efflux transporter [Gemmatimonadaceae bacterium]
MREIVAVFTRMGCTAFGGPAAHLAVMEAEVVTRRQWMTRAAFLDQLALVQLLPGPNSTEMAIHVGHERAGWRGGLVAGLCFVLPSVALVWLLAALVTGPFARPAMGAILWWLAPVVATVVLQALWKFGRQATERPHWPFVMPLTTVAAFVVSSDLVVLAIGAAASIVLAGISTRALARIAVVALAGAGASALWAQSGTMPASAPVDSWSVMLYFLQAGVSVFGSGYVLFAYLQHDLVDGRGWLSLAALTQASTFAQLTPGPLFTTATAVGFTLAGHMGALAATVGIFAPAFLSVAVSAHVRRLVERSPVLRAALHGVVLASVALLGRAVAGFGWGLEPWQWLVALGAATLLFAARASATLLLLAAALAGIVGHALHIIPTVPS